MTGSEYRKEHGDPATWTDTEYEQFEQYATPGDPAHAREVLARLNASKTDLTTAA